MTATLSRLSDLSVADLYSGPSDSSDVHDAPTRVMRRQELERATRTELEVTKARPRVSVAPKPKTSRVNVALGVLLAFSTGVAATLGLELYDRSLFFAAAEAHVTPPAPAELLPAAPVVHDDVACRPESHRRAALDQDEAQGADLAPAEASPARRPRSPSGVSDAPSLENLLEDGLAN